MRFPELIATHTNTDFDGFAAMVAARKLYPEAAICLGGAVNRNVREFQALYADLIPVVDPSDVDHDEVRRLILVDTVHANRLGELADLPGRDDVQVVAFDHHTHSGDLPPYVPRDALISSTDGSLVTLLVHILAQREIAVTSFEATVFALGIHEDTGSLTFSTTTPRDAEALAFCMRRGADTTVLEKWLASTLTGPQRRTLAAALDSAEQLPLTGATVLVSALRQDLYVEGVSVVAHRVMDLTGCDAFFLLVSMENRVFVTARSRAGRLDVAHVLGAIGGGGHTAAASAVVKERSLDEVKLLLTRAVPAALAPVRTARDALATDLSVVEQDTPVDEAALLCRREGLAGVLIADGDSLVGRVALIDLDRAAGHGLGHAPVKAVMTSGVTAVAADMPLEHVAATLSQEAIGWAPVVAGPPDDGPVPRAAVLGSVHRRAIAGGEHPAEQEAVVANLAGRLGELGLDEVLRHVQTVAAEVRGVYLVGGAVRDVLLAEQGVDIDLAVEGDGIAFAYDLAARIKGRVRAHEKFGTAVVVARDEHGVRRRIDVASTRSESYEHPAALPKVQHASIRSDLARRDFTINALAVSLRPESYGNLLDYFGGLDDLDARRIVVLHNLSFIEDPTRILRAVRYETRYGLRMDAHTHNLALAACDMDLVGDLSSARLRDELVALLQEEKVDFALRRIDELGLASSIHGRLRSGASSRRLVRRGDTLRQEHRLEAEMPRWRLRLIWLLRDLEPEEIAAWTERMRIRQSDATVLQRGLVVGRRMVDRLTRGPSEAELYDFARGEPLEAFVAAMVLDGSGISERRLGHYLDVTRHVRLAITGHDLLALGYTPSPRMGEVLRSVLYLKLNGVVDGRKDELAAAARMRQS